MEKVLFTASMKIISKCVKSRTKNKQSSQQFQGFQRINTHKHTHYLYINIVFAAHISHYLKTVLSWPYL